jgi:hypothetical protein
MFFGMLKQAGFKVDNEIAAIMQRNMMPNLRTKSTDKENAEVTVKDSLLGPDAAATRRTSRAMAKLTEADTNGKNGKSKAKGKTAQGKTETGGKTSPGKKKSPRGGKRRKRGRSALTTPDRANVLKVCHVPEKVG